MHKKLITFLGTVLLCILCFGVVHADTDNPNTYDYTESLTTEELTQLDKLAEDIYSQFDVHAYFVRTDDTGDLGTVDYTEKFYEEHAADSNCIIFTLTSDQYYVLPLGACADIFTDLEFESLYDAYISCDNYYDSVSAYYSEVLEILKTYETKSQIVVETDHFKGMRMTDDADIVDALTESAVSDKLDEISTQYECDIVIFTSSSISYKNYAADYYSFNGYGAGDNKFGIIFVVNTAADYWDVVPMGDNSEEKVFTNDGLKYIEKKLKPFVNKGKYDEAVKEYVKLCEDFLKQAENGKPYDNSNLPKDFLNPVVVIVVVATIVIVVVIAVVSVRKPSKKNRKRR